MQRAIKFRVWHKEFKKFLSSDEWLIDLNGQLRFLEFPRGNGDNATDSVFDIINENLYTIQQFTGLLDANNKEIYEGDIILNPKATEPENTGWIIKWINFGFYMILIGGEKWFEKGTENKFNLFENISEKYQIIGHIYDGQIYK